VLGRLAFHGAPVEPEHEYLRVFNGFAAALDARSLAVIAADTGVAGVFPVRAAYPAALDDARDQSATRSGIGAGIPGFDGAGVTVALIDTGVDLDHPFLEGKLLRGIDIVDPDDRRNATVRNSRACSQEAAGPTGFVGLRRVQRSSRSALPAGSRTPRAGWRCTRGRINCSRGSKPPSIPTGTVTSTTPRVWR
jgi:subtilisin family serine protease